MAATNSPIMYIGTGEHMNDWQQFQADRFVRKMLGLGDMQTFADEIGASGLGPVDLSAGFTLRVLYDQFSQMSSMGAIGSIIENIPGMNNLLASSSMKGENLNQRLRIYMTIMDSMTEKGLPTQYSIRFLMCDY